MERPKYLKMMAAVLQEFLNKTFVKRHLGRPIKQVVAKDKASIRDEEHQLTEAQRALNME